MRRWFFPGLLLLGGLLVTLALFVDLAPSGVVIAGRDFSRSYHHRISQPFPAGRLSTPQQDPDWRQQVVAEPVYVTVRAPRRLQTATVRLWYKGDVTDASLGLRLQPRFANDNFRYALQPLSEARSIQDGAWTVTEVSFSLDQAVFENGRLRFMVALPDKALGEWFLHRIEVEQRGQPLTPEYVWQNMRRRL